MKPKFLADENIELELVRALRDRCLGVDVLSHAEAGLAGKVDFEVLAFAHRTGRILITHDLRLQAAARKFPHSGIAIPRQVALGAILDELQLIYEGMDSAEWANKVAWIPL